MSLGVTFGALWCGPFADHGGGSNPPVQLSWLRERGLAPEL
ncbi:hypothetical protein ACFV9D_00645 [Streptomyces sp. NPDC059875]